ncbi:hypothetical protein [Falsiroseomonas oryzae]|uniref:hypothetical protein n=1 Tax=Falsiroseomonas oryzae TaxID=2766473 RepID=UPI0022EA343A|nr:hypothetical protein [Roseomonas sp. MO-31]
MIENDTGIFAYGTDAGSTETQVSVLTKMTRDVTLKRGTFSEPAEDGAEDLVAAAETSGYGLNDYALITDFNATTDATRDLHLLG